MTCRVQLVKTASMVRLRLERRGRVLARGSARVRAGRAELGLRSRGRLQAGSYELVLVYRTSGERPTIVRQPLRVAAG